MLIKVYSSDSIIGRLPSGCLLLVCGGIQSSTVKSKDGESSRFNFSLWHEFCFCAKQINSSGGLQVNINNLPGRLCTSRPYMDYKVPYKNIVRELRLSA